jgi:tetratricopeptide (TPR) repeat protein
LRIRKTAYASNPHHLDIADSLRSVGIVYTLQNNHSKALEHYEASLRIRKIAYEDNPNHPKIIESLNDIGDIYNNQNKHSKALEYYEECLRIEKIAYADNPNHLNIAVSLHNIACIYRDQSHYSKALEYFEECLRIRKIAYADNPNQPDIKTAQRNINTLTQSLKDQSPVVLLEYYITEKSKQYYANPDDPEACKALAIAIVNRYLHTHQHHIFYRIANTQMRQLKDSLMTLTSISVSEIRMLIHRATLSDRRSRELFADIMLSYKGENDNLSQPPLQPRP